MRASLGRVLRRWTASAHWEKQPPHSLSKLEYNTEAEFEKANRLVRRLYGLLRDGIANIETDARKRVTADIEIYANRPRGQDLHTPSIVDGELGADISSRRRAAV